MANYTNENGITINNPRFSLHKTLQCGQCFRYRILSPGEYLIVAFDRILRVKEKDGVTFYCSEKDFLDIWQDYFDLKRNYEQIESHLSEKDPYLKAAILDKTGLRLLKQEPWEMIISFILSQSKQIPHIQKLVEDLSKAYGTLLGEWEGVPYYAFPTPRQLEAVDEEALRALKVGYRAPYILDAVNKVLTGQVDLEKLKVLPYEEAKAMLLQIKGIGEKVADCVLLYGLQKFEAFPTDVWVKRVIEHCYFNEETSLVKIKGFIRSYFNEYAGFAQQYLFFYARDNKIGK